MLKNCDAIFESMRRQILYAAVTGSLILISTLANAQNPMPIPSATDASVPSEPSSLEALREQIQSTTPPAGIAIPAPAPPATTTLPAPPPPAALSNDAAQIAAQAEQAALQAQAKAEADQSKRDQEHIQKSYERAVNGMFPLTPEQIRGFMQKLETFQEAAQPPSSGPPKGEVRVKTLSLDPGVDPPQIELAAGYVTTITIVDSTGAPWPITDVGVGGNFEVSPTPAGTHVIRLVPLTRIGMGNMSVLLKDLTTPVIFRLSAGGPSVDLRYDARIPKYGPNAKIPLISRPKISAGDNDIMMVLENIPPKDAKRMKISGLDARTMAWMLNNRVFVRTPLTLLSPAWNASVASADGTKVYEIGDAPVLLMSDNGAVVRGRLLREDEP
ncbi:MAG: DotH/IcmK family type IV secretion protein [Alphaproteobacteria bacterium]|nr:DotH/IcmK family type IV secretion protein [Alphaproteobacteria bacterium]